MPNRWEDKTRQKVAQIAIYNVYTNRQLTNTLMSLTKAQWADLLTSNQHDIYGVDHVEDGVPEKYLLDEQKGLNRFLNLGGPIPTLKTRGRSKMWYIRGTPDEIMTKINDVINPTPR